MAPILLKVSTQTNHFTPFADLESEEEFWSSWKVCTKAKNALEHGNRLENLSWRLWHRKVWSSKSRMTSVQFRQLSLKTTRLLESDDKWGTSCKNKDGSNTNSPSTVTPASASCEIVVKKDDNNNKLSSHPAYVSVITTHDQQQQQQQQHHLNQTDSSFISLENFLSDVNSFQLDQSISNQFLPQSLPSATSQHHQQRRQQQHQQHSQNSLYDVILASLDDSTSTGDGGGSSMHHPHGQISSNYQHLPSPPIVSPVSEENSFFGGQPLHNHVNNNSSFPSSFTSTSVENSSSLSSSSSPALADMGSMYMPENSTSEHLSSAFPILSNCYPHPSLLSGSGVFGDVDSLMREVSKSQDIMFYGNTSAAAQHLNHQLMMGNNGLAVIPCRSSSVKTEKSLTAHFVSKENDEFGMTEDDFDKYNDMSLCVGDDKGNDEDVDDTNAGSSSSSSSTYTIDSQRQRRRRKDSQKSKASIPKNSTISNPVKKSHNNGAQHPHSYGFHPLPLSALVSGSSSEEIPTCKNCGISSTPLWRKTDEDELLCNACGLYYKFHKTHRPKPRHSQAPRKKKTVLDSKTTAAAEVSPIGSCSLSLGALAAASSSSSPTSSETGTAQVGPLSQDALPPLMACFNCETRITPLWRRDEQDHILCNACGLYLKLHGSKRPVSMKTDTIRKRQRSTMSNNGDGNDNKKKVKK